MKTKIQNLKIAAIAALLAALMSPVSSIAQAGEYGALAIDYNHGNSWGVSWNYDSQSDASQQALYECGGNCSIVMRFRNACAAYAVAGNNLDGSGWAWMPNSNYNALAMAQMRALNECNSEATNYGCQLRVWGCTGSAY